MDSRELSSCIAPLYIDVLLAVCMSLWYMETEVAGLGGTVILSLSMSVAMA